MGEQPDYLFNVSNECGGSEGHIWSGQRWWCANCSEWCYPEDGMCRGCEIPILRTKIIDTWDEAYGQGRDDEANQEPIRLNPHKE